MLELLKLYWLPLVKYAGVFIGLLMVYFKGRVDNSTAQQRREGMENLAGVKMRDKIENDLNGLSDDKLNKLYDKQIKRD